MLTRIEHGVSPYDGTPVLLGREGIVDRGVDLWSSLVAITFVADIEDHGNRTRDLLDLARTSAQCATPIPRRGRRRACCIDVCDQPKAASDVTNCWITKRLVTDLML
jgi:hypothetical protein